jgi:TonB family protein
MDWLIQLGAQVVCSIYWFNPLFWMAANRLYRESELACDDAVLRLGVDSRDYASHLLDIARSFRRTQTGWALAMAQPSDLEKRFAALLRAKMNREAIRPGRVALIVLATLGVLVPFATIQVSNAASASNLSDVTAPAVDQYTSPPLYSDEARSFGVEGKVVLEVAVGVDGKPMDLQVIRGLGFGLDQNALVAVRDWHFVPGRRNGRPVESSIRVVSAVAGILHYFWRVKLDVRQPIIYGIVLAVLLILRSRLGLRSAVASARRPFSRSSPIK